MATVEVFSPSSLTIVEKPVHIFFNGDPVAISEGSPYGLRELAAGYLLSEGIVGDRNRLIDIVADDENGKVYVESEECLGDAGIPLMRFSSAGAARNAVLQDADTHIKELRTRIPQHCSLENEPVFHADKVLEMMDKLCFESPRRNDGSCVHGCGIGSVDGLLFVREDVGRHNAMDKAIGQAWLDRIPLHDKCVLSTGRVSIEMLLKVYRAGVKVIVSRKSATDQAIHTAEKLDMTVITHCREGRMKVFSHPERLLNE